MDNPTLVYLDQIRQNLEYGDYGMIYQSVSDLKDKFIPSALLKKGHYIDRVRINECGQIFTNIEQVSYIHDKDVLKNKVDFGRANEPKQAVFYGAITSPQIKIPRAVAYSETSNLLKELGKHDNAEEVFTLSRWRILDDIEVLEMIFSDAALKVNEYTRSSLAHQLKNYQHLELAEHCEKQGKFFSNEFARNDVAKGEYFKYKITAAYANYVWRNTHLNGITYPSVSSDYLGQNIALLPEVVDKYLRLETVVMLKFERRNARNLPIGSFKIATDLGDECMNFQWRDYNGE